MWILGIERGGRRRENWGRRAAEKLYKYVYIYTNIYIYIRGSGEKQLV